MSNLCRTCGKVHLGINVCNLFDNSERSETLLNMIKTTTGLELQRQKYMPDKICAICQFELENAFEFRRICMQTNETLLHQANGVRSTHRNVDGNDLQSNEEDSYLTDFLNEAPLIDEQQLIEKLDKIYDKLVNSNGKTDNINEATTELNDVTLMTEERQSVIAPNNESLNTRTRRGGRITRYICEQCGQGYAFRGAFEAHVNRHNGVNPFECDLCSQKFNAKQSLKRHKMKHAGIQPYPCRFCDRRFLDYYLRLRHERMHNNIRPFKCTYCDKAFTTNTHLRNHILTHTKERPYSCDVCQQKFAFKKNVAIHCKSTRHKRNEQKYNDLQEKAN